MFGITAKKSKDMVKTADKWNDELDIQLKTLFIKTRKRDAVLTKAQHDLRCFQAAI